MALTRALAASGEQITNTERTVTSALAVDVVAFLPEIAAGAGATVAEGYTVTVQANAAGSVEIRDIFGRRIGRVARGEVRQFIAVGDASSNRWLAVAALEQLVSGGALATNGAQTPTLGANLPTGAATASANWLRVQLPNGDFGLLCVWDETA